MKKDRLFIYLIFCLLFYLITIQVKTYFIYNPGLFSEKKYAKFINKLKRDIGGDKIHFHKIKTIDENILEGIYLKNPNSNKLIIYYHGFDGDLSTRYNMTKFLSDFANVFIFDYRSYGLSEKCGMLNEENLMKDCYAVWTYVSNNIFSDCKNIAIYSEFEACYLVSKMCSELSQNFDKNIPFSLILNSPYLSTRNRLDNFLQKHFKIQENILSGPFLFLSNVFLSFTYLLNITLLGSEYDLENNCKYISKNIVILISYNENDHNQDSINKIKKLFVSDNATICAIKINKNSINFTDKYVSSLANILS